MIYYERYNVLPSLMRWNWQQPDWLNFTWNKSRLAQAEQQFLVGAGTLMGAVKHLDGEERSHITIETISTEAVTTAEIEGEILDRASVQSSIRRQFGLATDNRRVRPAELGGHGRDDGRSLPLVFRAAFGRDVVRMASDARQRPA